MSHIWSIYCRFVLYIVLFGVWCFWIITRCLARSQIFFLEKKSETCQENFSALRKSKLSLTCAISQNCRFIPHIWPIYYNFIWYILLFGIWGFWDNHEVPCGIWDIFSWQTIWDLSKIFSALRKSKLSLTCAISQNQHFMSISGQFIVNFGRYIVFFRIWVFLDNHEVACGIWDIFSWQTIWDLSKFFSSSEEIKTLLDMCNISESTLYIPYLVNLLSIWTIYCVF